MKTTRRASAVLAALAVSLTVASQASAVPAAEVATVDAGDPAGSDDVATPDLVTIAEIRTIYVDDTFDAMEDLAAAEADGDVEAVRVAFELVEDAALEYLDELWNAGPAGFDADYALIYACRDAVIGAFSEVRDLYDIAGLPALEDVMKALDVQLPKVAPLVDGYVLAFETAWGIAPVAPATTPVAPAAAAAAPVAASPAYTG